MIFLEINTLTNKMRVISYKNIQVDKKLKKNQYGNCDYKIIFYRNTGISHSSRNYFTLKNYTIQQIIKFLRAGKIQINKFTKRKKEKIIYI